MDKDHWSRESPRRRRAIGLCATVFVVVHLVAPWVVGECYPFTIAPMFRDAPRQYCEYRVLDATGRKLPLVDFQLQQNYDGNPPGLGVGIAPLPTINVFGQCQSPDEIRRVVRDRLATGPAEAQVVVEQYLVGPSERSVSARLRHRLVVRDNELAQ